jgi:single-stranded-DNA-specific exonuclease
MTNSKYNWIEPEYPNKGLLPRYHPIVANRLKNLKLHTEEQIESFLNPNLYKPSPGWQLPGLINVADKVEKAVRERQSICVWGDFDVDGQTSTAVLVSTIEKLGGIVSFHVPVRGSETHGISIPVLERIITNGIQLILTCDTGITAHEAVNFSNSRNVEVLITDHHDLPDELPNAAGITNPKLLKSSHPLANLAGVGVAYKLAEELFSRFGLDPDGLPVELAALGLVADLAILHGDTRFLVQKGLQSLKNTQILGLDLLLEASELDRENLSEEQISFNLAPRLNSLGRLSDANVGVELLTTTDPVRAKVITSTIEGLVAQSRLLSNQVFSAAEAQIAANPSLIEQPIVVLSYPNWPGGVLGIVSSRLVERYGKPFILLTRPEGEPARGSARSIEGFDIHKAISLQKDLLIQSGGHPMAAGMSMIKENIDLFKEKLNESIRSKTIEYSTERELPIDGFLSLGEVTLELAENLNFLAPYGPGNEKPVIVFRNLTIHDMVQIGRNDGHLKFIVKDGNGNSQTVLWWNAVDQSLPGRNIDLAANISINNWKGQKQVQLTFVDFRSSKINEIVAPASKFDVEDKRDKDEQLQIIERLPENSIAWLEGQNRKRLVERIFDINPDIQVVDRNGLISTKVLTILTTPPSQGVLNQILSTTNPEKIILIKDLEELTNAEQEIQYLVGLIKYSIKNHDGSTSISSLAAATRQDSKTIKQAILWLEARGDFKLIDETRDNIVLTAGNGQKDQQLAENQWKKLQHLFEETIAYQAFFKRADKSNIFHV